MYWKQFYSPNTFFDFVVAKNSMISTRPLDYFKSYFKTQLTNILTSLSAHTIFITCLLTKTVKVGHNFYYYDFYEYETNSFLSIFRNFWSILSIIR